MSSLEKKTPNKNKDLCNTNEECKKIKADANVHYKDSYLYSKPTLCIGDDSTNNKPKEISTYPKKSVKWSKNVIM